MQADNQYPYLNSLTGWPLFLCWGGGFTLGWVFVGFIAKLIWMLVLLGWSVIP